jgi:hypothetical protein
MTNSHNIIRSFRLKLSGRSIPFLFVTVLLFSFSYYISSLPFPPLSSFSLLSSSVFFFLKPSLLLLSFFSYSFHPRPPILSPSFPPPSLLSCSCSYSSLYNVLLFVFSLYSYSIASPISFSYYSCAPTVPFLLFLIVFLFSLSLHSSNPHNNVFRASEGQA